MNKLIQKKTCKIIVPYHKPDFLINNDLFIPIHAGRRVIEDKSKDGNLDEQEKLWLLSNMIGDDIGDNISDRNRYYSELTVVYWVWKNYDKLNSPDYIGLNHYRRIFAWSNIDDQSDARIFIDYISNDMLEKFCDIKKLNEIIKYYDIISPIAIELKESLEDQYKRNHDINDYNYMCEIINNKFPQLAQDTYEYLHGRKGIFANINIMKKEIFNEYCIFLFTVLDEMYLKITNDNLLEKKPRMFGYIAELLTGIFLYSMNKKPTIKIKFLPVIYPQKSHMQLDIYPIKDYIHIAVYFEQKYFYIYIVLLSSIIKNSFNKNYDIVLYGNEVQNNIKDLIINCFRKYKGLSIRFYNIYGLLYDTKNDLSKFNNMEYCNLFIPLIFKNFDKILSLNPYCIILEDLSLLYQTDISQYAIAGIQDYSILSIPYNILKNPLEYFSDTVGLSRPFENYIQPFIVLYNIKLINELNINKLMRAVIMANKLVFGYQDALNLVCGGKIKKVDSSWSVLTFEGHRRHFKNTNMTTSWQFIQWIEDCQHPKIISYSKGLAPWLYPDSHMSDYWWQYARNTPYYEKILYHSIEERFLSKKVQKKELPKYHKLHILLLHNYYRILSFISFGSLKNKFVNKRRYYANIKKQIFK